ncbi:thiamine pyrophosphate-binding protein [Aromatoleum buckelii]|uniref:Thiamine pyrophosphate-requiring protein n=1 Tax=Aromatoleum buckelii TaxID=200254 RepID=A0ABX1N065_9RHOO|nr:thiamine pyrophosphate-binding protein [Aromatoleum buckelii]MCK0509865.1 thiamine pyrophosphate-binding protein [Aromatoleum buckelii]
MSDTVGDFLLQRLSAWGVKRVFGYPGDGINGIMGAFGRYGEGLRFVQARHEELAAFMACAHAKFTGEVGVCLATSGPGAIHLLNGLYDAKLDHQPVWREWTDPRLVVMVLNNGDLNQVTWEQRAMEGDPKFIDAQAVPDFPYAEYARLLGLGGMRVDDPREVGTAWDAALSAERPTLLEMVTDPDVPPLPPHISAKQAKAYLSALLHGDPDSLGIVVASFKESWDSLFPPDKSSAG